MTSRRVRPSRRGTALIGLSLSLVVLIAAAPSAAQRTIAARTVSVDRLAPTAPGTLRVASAGLTSITLSWVRSSDNVRVLGYGVYRAGARIGFTTRTGYTVQNLTCGTSQLLGVDAFDAAGNRSRQVQVVAATAPCRDLSPPSRPGAMSQTGRTATTATLSWHPAGEPVGGYGVYVGSLRIASTQTTSYTFTNLSCGSPHQVGVDTFDLSGNRSAVTQYYVTTSACSDTQAPSAPGTVSVSNVTASGMTVQWGASTDDTAVTGYDVSFDGTTTRASVTRYDARGLACGRSYQIDVVALDAAGNRSAPTRATAATSACAAPAPPPAPPAPAPPAPPPAPAPDTTPPSLPPGLAVASASATEVSVTWLAASDNRGVTGYGVYRAGQRVGNVTTRVFTFTGLACGTTTELGVDAVDAAGNRSGVSSVLAATAACQDRTPPGPPVGLVVDGRTETSIAVRWSHGPGADTVGYRLYADGALAGTTDAGTFAYTFAGLSCARSYTLGVAGVDAAGNASTAIATIGTTLACPDTTAPAPPTNLSASNVTQTSATISWTGSAGAATYALSVNGASIGTSGLTSYTFSPLNCGTSYTFGVQAVDAAGNRSATSTRPVTTAACTAPSPPPPPPPAPAPPPSPPATGTVSLQQLYNQASDGAVIKIADGAVIKNDDASRDSATIFGASKQVRFECANPSSRWTVTSDPAPLLTIKADNVTVSGKCFKLHLLRVGEGGDPRGIRNVVVEDVKLDALEIVGAEATLRRVEIGPNVACFATWDTSVPASSRCNPNSPIEAERYWSDKGTISGFEPYFHANGAGVNAKVLLEQVWIHDIQSRDSARAHTGCALVWNNPQVVSDQIVIRNSRFERCAHLTMLVDGGHGITLEGNKFGPVVEPLDNVNFDYSRAATVAGAFAKDFGPRTDPRSGGGWQPTNYRVVGNTFHNGLGVSGGMGSFVNSVVSGNDLGRESQCWPGASYGANLPAGVCGSSLLPGPPPVPGAPPW